MRKLLLIIAVGMPSVFYGQFAATYNKAAQAYREAAAKSPCPEQKAAMLKYADYCTCLERSLQSGGQGNCIQPSGTIPECPSSPKLPAGKAETYAGGSLAPVTSADKLKGLAGGEFSPLSPGAATVPGGDLSLGLNQIVSAFSSPGYASTEMLTGGLFNVLGSVTKNDAGSQRAMQGMQNGYTLGSSLGKIAGLDNETSANIGIITSTLGGLFAQKQQRLEMEQQQRMLQMEENNKKALLRELGNKRRTLVEEFHAGTTDFEFLKDLQKAYVFFVEYNNHFENEKYELSVSNLVTIDRFPDSTWPTKSTLIEHYNVGKESTGNTNKVKCYGFFESMDEASVCIRRLASKLADAQTQIREAPVYVSSRKLHADKNRQDEAIKVAQKKKQNAALFDQTITKLQSGKLPLESDKLVNTEVFVYGVFYRDDTETAQVTYTTPFAVYKLSDGSWPFGKDIIKSIETRSERSMGQAGLHPYKKLLVCYFTSIDAAKQHQQQFAQILDMLEVFKQEIVYQTEKPTTSVQGTTKEFWKD